MRLSNQQLDSLAGKIAKEIMQQKQEQEQQAKANWLARNDNDKYMRGIYAEVEPALKALDKGLITGISLSDTRYKSYGNRADFQKALTEKVISENANLGHFKSPSQSDIRNELVLATIECENLQAIIEQVKSKFLNH